MSQPPVVQKLGIATISASSIDPAYPLNELDTHSHNTKGWQSARYCEFPVELLVKVGTSSNNQLEDQDSSNDTPLSRVRQIQILSHQCKIPTKIEIFTSSSPDPQTFQRLGYLSLDSNSRSSFQARELKSVYVDANCRFLKLKLHRCYINKFNLYNQVGIVAVNVLGETLTWNGGLDSENNEHPRHPTTQYVTSPQPLFQSPQPSVGGAGANSGSSPRYDGEGGGSATQVAPKNPTLQDVQHFPPPAAHILMSLIERKAAAVKAEDFDLAATLKGVFSRLYSLGSKLSGIEEKKVRLIRDEDYVGAKEIKVELNDLRAEVAKLIEDEAANVLEDHGVDILRKVEEPNTKQQQMQSMHQQASFASDQMNQQWRGGGDGGGGGMFEDEEEQQQQQQFEDERSAPSQQHQQQQQTQHQQGSDSPPLPNGGRSFPDAGSRFNDNSMIQSPEGGLQQQRTKQPQPQFEDEDEQPQPDFSSKPPRQAAAAAPSSSPFDRNAQARPYVDPMEIPIGGGKGAGPSGGLGASGMAGAYPEGEEPPPREEEADRQEEVNKAAAVAQKNNNSSKHTPTLNKTGGRMGRAIKYTEGGADSDEEFDISMDDSTPIGKKGGGGRAKSYAAGEHPLDGIPGVDSADLPEPGDLSSSAQEGYPVGLLGEYVIRCITDRNWLLREAGLAKICVLLSAGKLDISGASLYGPLCNLLKSSMTDKISQVSLTSLNVLQDCASCWSDKGASISALKSALDPVIIEVMKMLSNSNTKVRAEATATLSFLADCSAISFPHIAGMLMKVHAKRDVANPKALAGRINLLNEMVGRFGVKEGSALSTTHLMSFLKTQNCYAHTNVDVRGSAKTLSSSICLLIGEREIEKHLGSLRPKQMEEYRDEFKARRIANGEIVPDDKDDEDFDDEELPPSSRMPSSRTSPPSSAGGGSGRGRGRGRAGSATKKGDVGKVKAESDDTFTY
jgi:hypothetical protein